MLRTVLIEAVVFAVPFAVYALYLIVARYDVTEPDHWPAKVVIWCGGLALIFMVVSLLVLIHFSRAPAGSTYVPPHVEDGQVVPGHFE